MSTTYPNPATHVDVSINILIRKCIELLRNWYTCDGNLGQLAYPDRRLQQHVHLVIILIRQRDAQPAQPPLTGPYDVTLLVEWRPPHFQRLPYNRQGLVAAVQQGAVWSEEQLAGARAGDLGAALRVRKDKC